MPLLNLIPLAYRVYAAWALYALCAAVVVGAGTWFVHHEREIGRDEVRAEQAIKDKAREEEAFKETQVNAKETLRRFEAQQANQERQNEELKIARDAADRNARDAERVRQQSATAADQWSHTLRNSPTSADLAAAADTIRVLTDVRGRLDRHASVLASYATAAHLAGLKCERDYDALKP